MYGITEGGREKFSTNLFVLNTDIGPENETPVDFDSIVSYTVYGRKVSTSKSDQFVLHKFELHK